MKDRFEIAAALRQIARLLAITGENPYRTQAYLRGAGALETFAGDFDALVNAGRLQELRGVGSALAATIEEIYRTGECWRLEQMRRELPPGVIELSEVPGLSLKKIVALNETLGVETIADLKAAAEAGRLSQVKGFGAKAQAKLLADIEKIEAPESGFLLLDQALDIAEQLIGHLRACPELVEAASAGALRRRKEIIRRICIVAAAAQTKPILERFLSFPALARTEQVDETRCQARLAGEIPAELVIVPPEEYVVALHARTGTRNHLEKLADRSRRGPAALLRSRQKGGGRVKDERDIYRRLGLEFIPPELREDEGEIEAAGDGTLPRLITLEDIRGMTHCHTLYSDGRNGIEEMALAAQAMGMAYLTITDHSPSAHYARGVNIDRLRAQWDEIARVQERVDIKLLKGTESDILADGSLDYPDHYLERFDIVIASIHSRHKMDAEQMTARLLRVLQLPLFKIWGHPLGRLLQSRPPFECRMDEVLDAIAESRCAVEVNGDPRRLDLEPRWIRAARRRGIKFIVSTDAHSTGGLKNLRHGVSMARRGWLGRGDVLNTLDTDAFMRAVHP
jgi:DNA polymerase (family 10)